jgi:hypothetical protein
VRRRQSVPTRFERGRQCGLAARVLLLDSAQFLAQARDDRFTLALRRFACGEGSLQIRCLCRARRQLRDLRVQRCGFLAALARRVERRLQLLFELLAQRGELGQRGGIRRCALLVLSDGGLQLRDLRLRRIGGFARRRQAAVEVVDLLFDRRKALAGGAQLGELALSSAARSCAALRNDCAVTRSAASEARCRSASSSAPVRRANSAFSAARPRSRFGWVPAGSSSCARGVVALAAGSSLSASAQMRSDWLSAFSRPSAKPRGVGEKKTTTPIGAPAWKNGIAAMVKRRGLRATNALGTKGFSCAASMTLMRRLRRLRSGMSQPLTMLSPARICRASASMPVCASSRMRPPRCS